LTEADCAFCRLPGGEVDAHIVLADEATVAFLDHRPLFPGHTLLVPRAHVETLTDLPDELLLPFFSNARLLARAMEEGLGADGSFVAINNRVSQSVPHLHVHVVPRRRKDGLRGFFWPRQKYESEEQAAGVAARLRDAIATVRKTEGRETEGREREGLSTGAAKP
jgi:histidine triad (HIT) family protein